MHPSRMLAPILAGLTLSSAAFLAERNEEQALQELVKAEKAFSDRCRKVGFRQSFLENFDAAGVFFNPAPTIAVLDLKKQPEEKAPFSSSLLWAPETGDVAAAGDLGYTTGPFQSTPSDRSKPALYGTYFSVWKRESARAPWKVVLDFGTGGDGTQSEPKAVRFEPAPKFGEGQAKPGAAYGELISAEKDFAERARLAALADAMDGMASESIRIHRTGARPALGWPAAQRMLSPLGRVEEWTPTGGSISRSGDLGYTFGRYRLQKNGSGTVSGYFARVWKRDRSGDWKIVADIANEARSGK